MRSVLAVLRGGGGEPVARYNKYTLTASYLQPFQLFSERFSFDSVFSAQRSEDVLFSPQRFSLGGLYSIRGFKEQSSPATVVITCAISCVGHGLSHWNGCALSCRNTALSQPTIWARFVVINTTMNKAVRLASHAFELSARGQHLAASVTAAHTLSRPNAIERKERPPIYFRIDVFF